MISKEGNLLQLKDRRQYLFISGRVGIHRCSNSGLTNLHDQSEGRAQTRTDAGIQSFVSTR